MEEKSIDKLKAQKTELEASLNKAVEDGTIKKYSEEWYTMVGTIDDIAVSIEESTTRIWESYEDMFNGIADKYDATIGRFESKINVYGLRNERAQYTTKASNLGNTNYLNIVEQEQKVYDQAAKKREKQQAKLDEMVAEGLTVGGQKWNEMRAEINATTAEMVQSQINMAQAYVDMFDQIGSKYEGVLQSYDHTETMINEYIAQAEAKGQMVSAEYYNRLIKNETANIDTLKKKQADMIATRDEAVASGKIEKGSVAWYEMCAEIDGVTQEIEASETAILEWNNAIRNIEWEVFDLAQERIANLNDEAEFFIELMSDKKLYDDNGQLTDEGKATMGMHGQQYNTNMRLADNYGAEVAKLNEDIAKDPFNQDLINRRDELLGLQRDSILAAQQEKNAIKDLVEEGYNKELDALDAKIQKHQEELQSQKD